MQLKNNPFKRATTDDKRLKILVYGESGAGKSTLALQFPSPVVIDMERGTDLYSGKYDFFKTDTTGAEDVLDQVRWLHTNKHQHKTLVIDPITVYWESLQRQTAELKRAKKSKGKNGGEPYELTFPDWAAIKWQYKSLMLLLSAIDMNVILIAHEKTEYADGAMAVRSGTTFAAEKTTDYLMDVVLRLKRVAGRYMTEVIKDRTGELPTEDFVTSFDMFLTHYSGVMDQEATPFQRLGQGQLDKLIKLTERFTIDNIQNALQKYGVEDFAQLSADQADEIINKINDNIGA